MRVMYIMPRYHTNLVPTMKGWISAQHEVTVVTYTKGRIEDYSLVEPVVAGYSTAFRLFLSLYTNVIKRKDPNAKDISLKVGFPSIGKISRIIKRYKPEIVILREFNVYSIICTQVCKRYKIPTITYNQSPLWGEKGSIKNDLPHRIVYGLSPKVRITPVNQLGYDLEGKEANPRAVFAPFVMDLGQSPDEKQFFAGDRINILEIGKYEKRKNHMMMVDVFSKLADKYDASLTIVGEKSNQFHQDYFDKLEKYIAEKGLDDKICLKYNLSRQDVDAQYKKTDVFVLASTGEPAAISPIEAMSYSIPSICSTGNGTADYIVDGSTGYVFKDKDEDDLYNKLDELLSDRQKLVKMGTAAYERVRDYCSFEKYYDAVNKALTL